MSLACFSARAMASFDACSLVKLLLLLSRPPQAPAKRP